MRFTKMHGNGNDYIYVECFTQNVREEDAPGLARMVSNRNKGIGSDGLVLMRPSQIADCKMNMYNADGSQGMMCGNAVRCIGKFLYDKGFCKNKNLTVETLNGVKILELSLNPEGTVEIIRVNMGKPDFNPASIPMNYSGKDFITMPIMAAGREFIGTCVNTGPPHLVVYVEDLDNFDADTYGPALEKHAIFPDRTNVNFVQVLSREHIKTRTWERGSDETLACGSGASASAVVSALLNKTNRAPKVTQRGGDLLIEWDEVSDDIFMTGPAAFICDGEYLF